MPVNNKLGAATITVEADTSGFGKGLAAKLRVALAEGDREAKAAGKRLGRQVVDGIGDEIVRRTPLLRRRINAMLRGITVKAKVKLDVDVDQGNLSVTRLAARLRGNLAGEVLGAGKSLQGMLGGLFGNLMPKSLQQLGLMISLGSVLGAVLAGAFNATGRELLNVVKLSGFLPAALFSIAAVAGTVQVALSGVGDALSAVMSRDPEKIKEALKGLTPSARSFVLEFQKVLPILDRIKKVTQESFFKPLKGDLLDIATSLGGLVSRGMSQLAGAIGSLLHEVSAVLSSPGTQLFVRNLFQYTTQIIRDLSGPVSKLVGAIINIANAALPSLSKMLGGDLGGLIERFANWLNKIVEDGRFQKFLDSAQRTLKDLWYIVEQLGGLFGVLFDDANTEGKSFLEIVGDMIADFKDFAESEDGKLALEGIATTAKLAGIALLAIIVIIWTLIAAVGSFVGAVQRAINWVERLILKLRGVDTKNVNVAANAAAAAKIGAGHAAGAIVTRPEIAPIAEAGPEVVIPLTRPNRARDLAEQSGLTKILSGNGTTIQKFYLGTEQIDARIANISDSRIDRAVSDATSGTRAA